MKPYFSIIIPTFERASIIERAIQSVVNQTFLNWELIVVDDGSKDNTREVVGQYVRQDPRIQYHWQENKELNGARNKGIHLSSGMYILFLDDDDVFLPSHLAVLAQYLMFHNNPETIVKTTMKVVGKGKMETTSESLSGSRDEMVKRYWYNPQNLLTFAFHHQIFELNQFDENSILADDFNFLVNVLLLHPFVQLHECTAIYYLNDNSRSLRYIDRSKFDNKIANPSNKHGTTTLWH
ncbi:MAG: glycosyltransferase family 2 protein [Saprospiraceae bacterium]